MDDTQVLSPGQQDQNLDFALPLGAGFDFTDPLSPLARYYLQASHLAVVAILAIVFVFVNHVPLWHTDVWGHLKFGQWMVEHHQLPAGDPICPFAEKTVPYTNYCWLSQAGFYLIYHTGEILAGGDWQQRLAGGSSLLRVVQALLLVCRLAVLLIAFRRRSGSPGLALAALGLTIVLTLGNSIIFRPQIIGELLFAGLLLALSRPLLDRKNLVLIPLLMAFWANCHGSFLIGIFLLSVSLAGRFLEAGWHEGKFGLARAWMDFQVRRLFAVLAISCTAIAVMNPHGPNIFPITLAMASNPNVTAMDEWQPILFQKMTGAHWIFMATLLVIAGSRILSRRRFSVSQLLLVLAFGIQPIFHQRMLVWWLMLVPWLIVPLWTGITHRAIFSLPFTSLPSLRKTIMAALIIMVAVVWSIPGQWLMAGKPDALELSVSSGTPWQLAAQIKEEMPPQLAWEHNLRQFFQQHYPQGKLSGTIFASETLGDYLLWNLPPQNAVFIYTHVHLFSPEHWKQCASVKNGADDWQSVLASHRVNLLVVEPQLHPRLRSLIHRDAQWQVLLDESESRVKPDKKLQWLVAVRKTPL